MPGSSPNRFDGRAENTPPLSNVNFNNPYTNQYIKSATNIRSVSDAVSGNSVPTSNGFVSQNPFGSIQPTNVMNIGAFSPYEEIDDLSPKTTAESEDINRYIGEDVSPELDFDDEAFLNGQRMLSALQNVSSRVIEEAEYPFTGGQMPGVLYQVLLEYLHPNFGWLSAGGDIYLGPITFEKIGDRWYLNGIRLGVSEYRIKTVYRVDGQPDTGGNPPPTKAEVTYTPVLSSRQQEATSNKPLPLEYPSVLNQIVSGIPKNNSTQEIVSGLSDYSDAELERILDEYGIESIQETLSREINRSEALNSQLAELNKQLTEVNERLKTEQENRQLEQLKTDIERQITITEANKQTQRELFGRMTVDANTQPSTNPLINPTTIATGLALGAIATGTGANINPFGNPSPTIPNASTGSRVPQSTNTSPNNVIQFPKTPEQKNRENITDKKTTNEAPKVQPTPNTCQNTDDPMYKCIGNIERGMANQKGTLDEIKDFFKNKLDTALNALNAFLQAFDIGLLMRIDNKLGAQLPGGLSGFLTDVFTRLWNSRIVDRALNIIGVAASIHNAVMLSRNVGTTLGAVISNVLGIFGVKDPEATTDKIGEIINGTIENLVKSIVGAENYESLTKTWASANRIYQAATNIYQMMTDSTYAIAEGLGKLGERTGKIGNALKASGILLENTLEWLDENSNIHIGKNRKLNALINGLQGAQEVASDLEDITSNFREATENVTEIKEEMGNLKKEVDDLTKVKKEEENKAKTDSQGANITRTDLVKPEG
ncbi:hypothetical protein [Pannus brasiliensis]